MLLDASYLQAAKLGPVERHSTRALPTAFQSSFNSDEGQDFVSPAGNLTGRRSTLSARREVPKTAAL